MLVNGPIILRTSGSTRVDADMIEARWLRLGERQGRRNTSLKYWFIFLGVAVFYMFFYSGDQLKVCSSCARAAAEHDKADDAMAYASSAHVTS
jgi:hypothetical protein